jgi:hypothetical protein
MNTKEKAHESITFTFTIASDYDLIKTVELINNIQIDWTSNEFFNVLVVDDNKINYKKDYFKNNYRWTVVDSGMAAPESAMVKDVEKNGVRTLFDNNFCFSVFFFLFVSLVIVIELLLASVLTPSFFK